MARRTSALAVGLVAIVVLAGACGNSVKPKVSGGLRKLPFGAAAGGGGATKGGAAASTAMSSDSAGSAAPACARLEAVPTGRLQGALDLPEHKDPQAAYALVNKVVPADVERLAEAVGVNGSATQDNGTWTVTNGDRQLMVYPSSVPAWSLQSMTGGMGVVSSGVAVGCAPPPVCAKDQACAPACAPPETTVPPPPPKDLPTKDEAAAIGKRIATAAGLNVEKAEVTVEDAGSAGWSVRVQPSIDGMPVVGLDQYVTIGSKSAIEYANGTMVKTEKLGDYPVIGAKAGIDRLNKGDLYYGGGPRPMMAQAGGGGYSGVATDPTATNTAQADPGSIAPEPPVSDPPVNGTPSPTELAPEPAPTSSLPPREVTITAVRNVLTLVVSGCSMENAFLVPAYEFSAAKDEGTFTVPSVTDEFLEATQADQRLATKPMACPDTSGGVGTKPDEPIATPTPGASGSSGSGGSRPSPTSP